MAQSGHPGRARQCLLSGVKRTSQFQTAMSAFDPIRTCRSLLCRATISARRILLSLRFDAARADYPLGPGWKDDRPTGPYIHHFKCRALDLVTREFFCRNLNPAAFREVKCAFGIEVPQASVQLRSTLVPPW
jgi:hypothetical protein